MEAERGRCGCRFVVAAFQAAVDDVDPVDTVDDMDVVDIGWAMWRGAAWCF